jgi:hypothetical protein
MESSSSSSSTLVIGRVWYLESGTQVGLPNFRTFLTIRYRYAWANLF